MGGPLVVIGHRPQSLEAGQKKKKKSQNAPHVDVTAPCPFLEPGTVIILPISNLVGGLRRTQNLGKGVVV